MITHKKSIYKPEPSPSDVALLSELQSEIARLESERTKAANRSDKLFSRLTNDDTGFSFHQALNRVNGLNERIQQLRNLAEKVRGRIY